MRRLRNLLAGLPPEARLSKEDPDEPEWGVMEELTALLIEEVSILAAERRRKEPLDVPRPVEEYRREVTRQRRATADASLEAMHGGLLAAAMKAGMVNPSPEAVTRV